MSGGDVEKQVYSAESEQRNVAQTIHATPKAGVTSQPVFVVEEEALNHSCDKAEKDPGPGQDHVGVGFHRLNFRFMSGTIDSRVCEVLIEKTAGNIGSFDGAACRFENSVERRVSA